MSNDLPVSCGFIFVKLVKEPPLNYHKQSTMPLASSFSGAFWEPNFTTQPGFETLVSRMKAGRQTCRDVEEFLKQRAKAEEEYAKSLLKIARY